MPRASGALFYKILLLVQLIFLEYFILGFGAEKPYRTTISKGKVRSILLKQWYN